MLFKDAKEIYMPDGGNVKEIRDKDGQVIWSGKYRGPLCVSFKQAAWNFSLSSYNNVKTWNGILEYSTDNITWQEWNGETILGGIDTSGPVDFYRIYLRGKNNTIITGDTGKFIVDARDGSRVVVEGNMNTLLDYELVSQKIEPLMSPYCFAHIFERTWGSAILSINFFATFPSKILSAYCYYRSLYNAVALKIPVKLPATEMKEGCYKEMFYGTQIKLSETRTGSYIKEFRIPTKGTGTEATDWNMDMFGGTSGTFRGSPEINRTYYYE